MAKRNVSLIIFGFAFFFAFIHLVSSAPPFQTNTNGIIIAGAVDNAYPPNTTLQFPYHIFNATNGQQLDNTSTTCSFHLINSTGEHIVVMNYNVPYVKDQMEFEPVILQGNYTIGQAYTNMFSCNTTSIGGFVQNGYIITPTGKEFSTSNAISYMGFFGILIFLFVLSLVLIVKLPGGNSRGERGQIVGVSILKYLRPALIGTAWTLLASILYIGASIAQNYLNDSSFYLIFFTISKFMLYMLIPGLLIYLVWAMVQVADDRKIRNLLGRGVEIE